MTLGAEDSPATFPYGPARSKSFQNLVSKFVHSFLLFHTVGVSGVHPVWSCHQERIMKHPDLLLNMDAYPGWDPSRTSAKTLQCLPPSRWPNESNRPCDLSAPTPNAHNTTKSVTQKTVIKKLVANDKHQFSLPFSGSSNFCKSFDLRARHPRNLGKLTAGSFGDVENWGITHVGPGLRL